MVLMTEVFCKIVILADLPEYDAAQPYHCEFCNAEITGLVCHDDCCGNVICAECYTSAESEEERIFDESPARIAEAVSMCKATADFPVFDESETWAPTPEQYERGERDAYTENSYRCYCRHSCTNYDDLIRNLDRHDAADQLVYDAIRARIDELVEQYSRSA